MTDSSLARGTAVEAQHGRYDLRRPDMICKPGRQDDDGSDDMERQDDEHEPLPAARSLLEREDALPVVLHADDGPALRLRLVVERGREGADPAVGQALRRAIGV